jgi:hypothetical protein
MLSPSQFSRSLILFTLAVIAIGTALGHAVTAIGIAVFLFLLASIEGKPSWRRIWDPDNKGEDGVLRFFSWKGGDARPNQRNRIIRP